MLKELSTIFFPATREPETAVTLQAEVHHPPGQAQGTEGRGREAAGGNVPVESQWQSTDNQMYTGTAILVKSFHWLIGSPFCFVMTNF